MDSFKDVWDEVVAVCKPQISPVAYNVWISNIEPEAMDNGTAYLRVKSSFQKRILEENYINLLKDAFENVFGFPIMINIISADEEAATQKPITGHCDGRSDPDEDYSFDNFIVGPSNKLAHAASLSVATSPSGKYNPLFIYGGSGLGKTHLLFAIQNKIKKDKNLNIIYVKGDDFTNALIEAIKTDTTAIFHNKYRNADVLLFDDIQFIAGKKQTQEEFFHTFDAFYQTGKQIVLTSDRPPKEIQSLEDRLRTRFEWGLLADIQAPDLETRMAIIKRKCEILDFTIPDDVCLFIANKLKSNIRQIEGILKKMQASFNLEGKSPSISTAQIAIRDVFNDTMPAPITVEKIIEEVARTYGVSCEDIRSTKRFAEISKARQTAIYVVRETTQLSMAAIGNEFGGRNHATIVYTLQQVEKQIAKDSSYKATVEDIIKNIKNL